MKQWAAGDFCFHEFRLSMIKEMREHGAAIGNGTIETFGKLDYCLPLEYKVLQISQTFEHYYDQLHRDTERFSLNWPDIHWWFVKKWMEACDNKDNDKECSKCISEVIEFCREITDGCESLRAKTVSGVTAFARR